MKDQPLGAGAAGDGADEFAPDPRNVRLLKFVVIGLGVLLVIGTIVLIVTIAYRASTLKGKTAVDGFGELPVSVPAGTAVNSMTLDGDRLAVNAGNEIIIVDLRKGTVIGRIRLDAK